MAHAYTPGLKIIPYTVVRKKRLLPIPGKVMVEKGSKVRAEDIVASTELPGKVQSVNIANRLGIMAQEIREYMIKKEGDKIGAKEALAQTKPFISWFKTVVKSPVGGTVETVSDVTGQVLLREPPKLLNIAAYVDATVLEVYPNFGVLVETEGAFIQGIFGIGGETNGTVAIASESPDEELLPEHILDEHKGCIVVGGSHVGLDAIQKAKRSGVKALVVGGIHDRDLRQLLGYDIGVAVTGTENIGLSLIITEGFGMIPMAEHTFRLLSSRKGHKASLSGATQIRAGVMRPEILIPGCPSDETKCKKDEGRGWLDIGDRVRVIREPHFGQIGLVSDLPSELRSVATESKVRVLEVTLAGGEKLVIPRANVEILEE